MYIVFNKLYTFIFYNNWIFKFFLEKRMFCKHTNSIKKQNLHITVPLTLTLDFQVFVDYVCHKEYFI